MFNVTLHRVSYLVKALLLFVVFCGTVFGLGYFLQQEVQGYLLQTYGITLDVRLMMAGIEYRSIGVLVLGFLGFYVLMVADVVAFSRRFLGEIKESLEDRKLATNFSEFYRSVSFNESIQKLGDVFSLYKSLDNLKTARIVLEVGTIRQMMNVVSEGLILVSKDMVVTHINHVAEEELGLIPGESIGDAISRKISDQTLLDSLEKVFEFDQKVLEVSLEDEPLEASVFPLKDKFGDVLRALVLLKKVPKKTASKATTKDG